MHCDNILESQLRMKRDDDQARAIHAHFHFHTFGFLPSPTLKQPA
jgi:hypothetical protein